MEFSKILERIRALIAKAESLEASGDPLEANEAQACRDAADKLMQKYAVEEWQTMAKAPVKAKPTRIKIEIGDEDNPFLSEMATLVNIVANFCKCSSIWMAGSGLKIGDFERKEYCWVYGYESDLRYFELLFTTLFLHMSGAVFPTPDPNKSYAENIYELHNAGLNWFDIAKAFGWYKVVSEPWEPVDVYVNRNTGERLSWSKSIGKIKREYQAEIARRGEKALRIPPTGSMTFRLNAAHGYLSRIRQRLAEVAGQRGTGAELVLADKSQNITAAMSEDFPNMRTAAAKTATYNETAYRTGVRHANTASLNPEAGSGNRNALPGA